MAEMKTTRVALAKDVQLYRGGLSHPFTGKVELELPHDHARPLLESGHLVVAPAEKAEAE